MGKSKGAGRDESTAESIVTTPRDSWKVTGWDSVSSVVQAGTALVLVFVTAWLMCQSNRIARRANQVIENSDKNTTELTKEIRRFEVRPVLRLAGTRMVNKYRKADAIVIRLKNVGNGSALDLNVILKEGGRGFCRELIHLFYPIGIFPRFVPADSIYAYSPVVPELDTLLIRDFILPGEELEFQYGIAPLGLRSFATTLILYLSYFDTDGNEYLTSTSLVPGANTMRISLHGSGSLLDSLDSIGPPNLYEYNTLVNPGLRERGRFWGTEER